MANTQRKDELEGMNKYDRKWDELTTRYDKQRKASSENYDRAYSQQDRALIGRGMQRSSAAMQSLANLRKQGNDAQNEIWDTQNAEYANWLNQQEQIDKEDERWERQFAEGQRQFNEGQGLQREQMAQNQAQYEGNLAFNYANMAQSKELTQAQMAQSKELTQAQMAQNQSQFETNLAYNRERAAAADEQWNKEYQRSLDQFNQQMAYQRERANVSDAQWEKEYAEKLRQFNEQMEENKRQFNATFGLQQDQFEWQKSMAAGGGSGGGGGYGGSYSPSSNPRTDNPDKPTDDDLETDAKATWADAAALLKGKKVTYSPTTIAKTTKKEDLVVNKNMRTKK